MDNVEPFFYYLASYYENDTPWIEYDIHFAVSILKDDNVTLITNVVYSIVAEDDHLRIVNREYYGWNIVEAPFKISIYVNANYIQPRMPQIRITHPHPLPHLNKSFKTETCVICLTKNLTFYFTIVSIHAYV